jgi:hypothetical protein
MLSRSRVVCQGEKAHFVDGTQPWEIRGLTQRFNMSRAIQLGDDTCRKTLGGFLFTTSIIDIHLRVILTNIFYQFWIGCKSNIYTNLIVRRNISFKHRGRKEFY